MTYGSLKTKNEEAAAPRDNVDEMSARIYALAREARVHEIPAEKVSADGATRVIPDFTRISKLSGRAMLISDAVALFAAFTVAGFAAWAANYYLFSDGVRQLSEIFSVEQLVIFVILGTAALLWFDTKGHYRQRLPHWEMAGHMLTAGFIGFIVSGFVHFASKDYSSRLWIGLSCVLFAAFIYGGRFLTRRALHRHGQWEIPAVIIGTGLTAQTALNAMKREPHMGFTIVGQVSPAALGELEKSHAWKHLLMTHKACHVFLALEGSEIEENSSAIKSMTRARVPCSIIPPWIGLPSSTLSPHHFMMQDVMLLHDTNRLQLPLPRLLKRSFDIVASGLALVALAPLFAVVALKVRRDGGPAFFKQARVGLNGQLFECYKFRSMRIDAERFLATHLVENPEAAVEWQQFQKLKNDVRVTRFGRFIRKTSIDELPQLINVFKGEMSLVGPRPCMPGQENLYAEDFSYYEAVRPGITGPWQVSGRSKLAFMERVRLESWYTRNWSFWMDIVIILKTVPALLSKDQAF
jgi:undecaprenyl-phosphate galactose phosphotransferase